VSTYTAPVPSLDSPALVRYGLPEYIQLQAPAAGADFTQAIGGAFFVRLVSVFVRLVADANVASREVVVSYETGENNRYGLAGINTTVTASNTADYYFGAFVPEAVATVDNSALVPLPQVLLPPGHQFKIHVVNIQVGDQLSRIRVVWERFYTTGQPWPNDPLPGP
jgi:hypothetical protein